MKNQYFDELLFLERKVNELTLKIARDEGMEFPGYAYLVSASKLLGESCFFFKDRDESTDRM